MSTSVDSQSQASARRYGPRMSDSDALMWAIEKDPMLRSTITTVMMLDATVEHERILGTFERVSRAMPRLRQRVRSDPLSLAPPRWEVDPNFDIRYHLRSARVTGEGSMQDLLSMIAPISMQGFDRARPLWEATMVEGLTSGRSAMVLKFHHSISDGVGGVELMLELLDLEPDAPARPLPPLPRTHVLNQAECVVDAFQYEARRQIAAIQEAAQSSVEMIRGAAHDPTGMMNASMEMAASVGRLLRPESTPLSAITRRRSMSNHLDVLAMPLDLAKEAGRAYGSSLNDVFVAGIIRGMDTYHRRHGFEQRKLRMGMPINVRGAASMHEVGNQWVPARFEVDLPHRSLPELLERVRIRTRAARDEPANDLVAPMSGILNHLPTTFLTQLFGTMMKGLDFQASNVPGSPVPIYLDGVRVLAIYPFGPLAGAGVNVTLLSYGNDLNIGVNIDPAAIPDVEVFMESLREAYDDLLELA